MAMFRGHVRVKMLRSILPPPPPSLNIQRKMTHMSEKQPKPLWFSTMSTTRRLPQKNTHRLPERLTGTPSRRLRYAGHVPTSPLNKLILAVHSGLQVLQNPERAQELAILGEVTGERVLRTMHLRMCQDPQGLRILEDKPRLRTGTSSNLINLDALRSLPESTFGRQYVRFIDQHGFHPNERASVQYVDDPELAYVMLRFREMHDFWHVLFDLPPSELGEIGLKLVELVQTGLPVCALSGLLGPLRLSAGERGHVWSRYVPWAHRQGLKCPNLLCVYYEREFETDLEELRAQLEIERAPAYVEEGVRS